MGTSVDGGTARKRKDHGVLDHCPSLCRIEDHEDDEEDDGAEKEDPVVPCDLVADVSDHRFQTGKSSEIPFWNSRIVHRSSIA